jgi:hypothetical protein
MYRTVTIERPLSPADMLARLRAATRTDARLWKWLDLDFRWFGEERSGVLLEGRIEGDAFILRRRAFLARPASWALAYGRVEPAPGGGSRLVAALKPHPLNLFALGVGALAIVITMVTSGWQAATGRTPVLDAVTLVIGLSVVLVVVVGLHYGYGARAMERSLRESLDRPVPSSTPTTPARGVTAQSTSRP